MARSERNDQCIYCREPAGSKEHLLPSGMGGNLTDTFICQTCNSTLGSSIDQALMEASPVTFTRIFHEVPYSVSVGGVHVIHTDTLDLEVRIKNGYSPMVLPQLHLWPREKGEQLTFVRAPEDARELHADFVAAVKAGFKKTSVGVHPSVRHPRMVKVRRNGFVVRAATHDEATHFKTRLVEHYQNELEMAEDSAVSTLPIPRVESNVVLDITKMERALTKIAFNLFAHGAGVDLALNPAFDAVRRFVKNGRTTPQVMVRIWSGPGFPFSEPELDHQVVLLFSNPSDQEQMTSACITLYKKFNVVVYFRGASVGALDPMMWQFSADRLVNVRLDATDILYIANRKLQEKVFREFPDALSDYPPYSILDKLR